MGQRHTLHVRYGECDMQGVVFNAHYLAYCDDAITAWVTQALGDAVPYTGNRDATFDFMLKKAEVTWFGPFVFGDIVDLDCSIARWGNTSMDIEVRGSVAGNERFVARLVQVSVTPGTQTPVRIPDFVRETLSDR